MAHRAGAVRSAGRIAEPLVKWAVGYSEDLPRIIIARQSRDDAADRAGFPRCRGHPIRAGLELAARPCRYAGKTVG